MKLILENWKKYVNGIKEAQDLNNPLAVIRSLLHEPPSLKRDNKIAWFRAHGRALDFKEVIDDYLESHNYMRHQFKYQQMLRDAPEAVKDVAMAMLSSGQKVAEEAIQRNFAYGNQGYAWERHEKEEALREKWTNRVVVRERSSGPLYQQSAQGDSQEEWTIGDSGGPHSYGPYYLIYSPVEDHWSWSRYHLRGQGSQGILGKHVEGTKRAIEWASRYYQS